MVKGDKKQGFKKLTLNGRAFHRHNRLLREDRHTFLDCPDVAMEFKIFKVIEKCLVERTG